MVAAVSPLAQRCGVQLHMPLADAKSLLYRSSRSQTFHILAHDPAADLYAIEKLADELDGFSPIIGLQQEVDHPDCIFLDVTGLAPLFDGELKLAQSLDHFCREMGYLVEIAIANTVGQAQALAQYQGHFPKTNPPPIESSESPTQPANIYILQQPTVLEQLPTAALRLSDWTLETLGQLGVTTIGQLLQLSRQALSSRFGNEIHHRLDQLSGKLAEPIIARSAPSEFHAEQLLDYPTSNRETIEVIIQRLIAKICDRLAAAQQGALQWTIRLYGQHKLPLKLCVSLFEPTATTQHVVQLANMQLEQLLMAGTNRTRKNKKQVNLNLRNEPLQINEITVSVTSCVLLVQKQRQLFDENPRLDKRELAHLINRLAGRLGRQQVLYPTIVSGAQPEYAFQLRPLVDPHRKRARQIMTSKMKTSSHVISRPLRMFRPAIMLQAQCDDDVDPQNAQLMIEEQPHIVLQRWGPERIETGWWRGRTTRRDYWRVETDQHQQFWIYRDLRQRTWFLQGEF